VQSQLAGIRTFALLTVSGAVGALIGQGTNGWVIGLGGVGVATLLVVGNLTQPEAKEADPGLTTEVAALLMYGVGAYLVVGHTALEIVIGGGVALLLHLKEPMHAFVARIGETDHKVVLIALVIPTSRPRPSARATFWKACIKSREGGSPCPIRTPCFAAAIAAPLAVVQLAFQPRTPASPPAWVALQRGRTA